MSLAERFNRLRFGRAVRALRDTPPLAPGDVAYTVLSMVQHGDVLPYLLALKSLARFLPPAHVVVVADPSLDAADRALLRRHVPHLRLHEAADFHRDGRLRGGTWERLWAIAEHVDRGSYVVQLDADTVTLRMPHEVGAALRDGVSFTLGTDDGQAIRPAREVAAWAQRRPDAMQHVQGLAEAHLDRFDPDDDWQYVRGCSGFAGFAARSIDAGRLAGLSDRMHALLGERWAAWGSEQVGSNLLVASSPGARLLPHPAYCAPHRRSAETVFLHFIGYVRHASGLYAQLARDTAGQLAAGGAAPRQASTSSST